MNSSSSGISPQTLKFILSSITNAATTQLSSNFSINSYYDGGNDSLVATGSINGVTAVPGILDSSKISLKASSYTTLASPVTYTISFVNTYQIPQNGLITIQFPLDIGIDTVNTPNNCFQSFNQSTTLISSNCSIVQSTYYLITFTSIASSSSINAGTNISLTLQLMCINPDTTRNVNEFAITTYSPGNFII